MTLELNLLISKYITHSTSIIVEVIIEHTKIGCRLGYVEAIQIYGNDISGRGNYITCSMLSISNILSTVPFVVEMVFDEMAPLTITFD